MAQRSVPVGNAGHVAGTLRCAQRDRNAGFRRSSVNSYQFCSDGVLLSPSAKLRMKRTTSRGRSICGR